MKATANYVVEPTPVTAHRFLKSRGGAAHHGRCAAKSRSRKMRMLAIAFVFAFGGATAQAAEYSKAISIIEEEGQFLFTDGSSYYLFFKDGYFDSGPLTLSGRTIQGTWKQSGDYQFIIEGKWSWLNGAYLPNDKRRLVMNIQPPFVYQPDESRNAFISRHMIHPPRMYRCYFAIEELIKTRDKK